MRSTSCPKAAAPKATLRTLDAKPQHGEMIKPAELIDISGAGPLTLAARRLYNALVAHAFGPDMAKEGHEWTIALAEVRGTHKGCERIADSVLALMRTVVTVRLTNGQTRRVQLLGGNDMGDERRSRGVLTYSFDRRLVELLKHSTIFGKLEIAVMLAFSTKYALALYEAVARRARLSHRFSEEWSLEELRDILGVPTGKLTTFGNLNRYAIKPAVKEINAFAAFGVRISPRKSGRRVVGARVSWWRKDVEELKAAFAALRRNRGERGPSPPRSPRPAKSRMRNGGVAAEDAEERPRLTRVPHVLEIAPPRTRGRSAVRKMPPEGRL